jgi:hypothetical protein
MRQLASMKFRFLAAEDHLASLHFSAASSWGMRNSRLACRFMSMRWIAVATMLHEGDQIRRVHLDQPLERNVVRVVNQQLQTEGQQLSFDRNFCGLPTAPVQQSTAQL